MSRGRLVVLLPLAEEGFYLPALEAMAMGCVVICPDCVGNRAFCVDEVTALVPDHDVAAVEAAVDECDRFYPAFQFILWGDKSPTDALASAMVDAAGEA